VEHNPAGSNSDSASPQNQSADDVVSKPATEFNWFDHQIRETTEFFRILNRRDRQSFVTLYTIEREFGGHEEGGWYYDWLTPVVCEFVPPTFDPAVEMTDDDWKARFRENYGARFEGDELHNGSKTPSYTSCSHYRATHVFYREEVPFSNASKTRPHYE
jgi:hypothetical protein